MNRSVGDAEVYKISPEVVAREIEGELIIVPLTTGIGEDEEDLFSLNETGKEIWRRLDGKRTLADVATALVEEYAGSPAEIRRDLKGLIRELLRRKMVVRVPDRRRSRPSIREK
jgi:hypothetical protein